MKNGFFIVVCACLVALQVWAVPTTVKTQSEFEADNSTSELLFSKNRNRKGLVISNSSSVVLYVKFGASHVLTEGIAIASGGTLDFQNVPMDSVYVKLSATTASSRIRAAEFE